MGRNFVDEQFLAQGGLPKGFSTYAGDTLAVPITQYLDEAQLSKGEVTLKVKSVNGGTILPAKLYGEYCLIVTPSKEGEMNIPYSVEYADRKSFQGKVALTVKDETGIERGIRRAWEQDVYRTCGIVGYMIGPNGEKVIPEPGNRFFVGRDLVNPTEVKLNREGNFKEAVMDMDYAGQRSRQDLFGSGSVRCFKDKYGIVHAVRNNGSDILRPLRAIGNSLENATLSVNNGLESLLQPLTVSDDVSAGLAGVSDTFDMTLIYFQKTHPLTGDAWRRVHSFVTHDEKLTLPLVGYILTPEFPMHTEKNPEKIIKGMVVYNADFAKLNPDWAVNLDGVTKGAEIVGALAWDVGYILLISSLANRGGGGGKGGAGAAEAPPPAPPFGP